MIRGLLFDLDGVLVNTNPLHARAWQELAEELGIPLTPEDHEAFLGVSREQCLEMLLKKGNRTCSSREKEQLCARKNHRYREFIGGLTPAALLPGVPEFLRAARMEGYRTALGSVSKNAGSILEKLEITAFFDAVIDGTKIANGKPNPEVFLKGAEALGLPPEQCLVFEDSAAGIEAAHRGGMKAIGIGTARLLPAAELTIPSFFGVMPDALLAQLL